VRHLQQHATRHVAQGVAAASPAAATAEARQSAEMALVGCYRSTAKARGVVLGWSWLAVAVAQPAERAVASAVRPKIAGISASIRRPTNSPHTARRARFLTTSPR